MNETASQGNTGRLSIEIYNFDLGHAKICAAFVHHERGQKDAECGLRLRAAKGGSARDERLTELTGPDVKNLEFRF